jgi:hypothetical protein
LTKSKLWRSETSANLSLEPLGPLGHARERGFAARIPHGTWPARGGVMSASSLLQELGRVAWLLSVGFALSRVRWQAQPGVHLLATSAAHLQALCRTAGALARAWPPPKMISVDVSPIVATLDGASIAQLERACRRWRRAGIAVRIEGCDRWLSAALTRSGLDAELLGSERASGIERISQPARATDRPGHVPTPGSVEPSSD